MTTFQQFLGFVWDGLVIGLLIGLAGIGLSLTYSILGFANFAHGDYVSTGAFVGWSVAYLVAGLGRFDPTGLLLIGYGDGPAPGDVGISITNTPLSILLGMVVAIAATVLVAVLIDREKGHFWESPLYITHLYNHCRRVGR